MTLRSLFWMVLALASSAEAGTAPPVPRSLTRGLPPAASSIDAAPGKEAATSYGEVDTFRIAAILVEFPSDANALTTGDGTLGDVLDANEAIYGESVFPELLDIPHDPAYFREQLRYLTQYFRAVSGGALEIVATLPDTIFVLPESMGFYGDNEDPTARQAALLRDAILLGDPLIDYSLYNGVFVYHAGVGEETDIFGDSPGDIWTAYLHRADLAEALADSGTEDRYRGIATGDRTALGDTVFVDEGVILPESETQDGYIQWILGVSAHMAGRLMGAPSLFDTDSEDGSDGQGIGSFGIMGTGLWNSGGILPPHPCAWTKLFFGWADPLVVTRDTTLEIPLVERADSRPKMVKVPISDHEYYLLENRYPDENGNGAFDFYDENEDNILYPFIDSYEGAEFDWSLPDEGSLEGSGLFVWHIDEGKIAESGDFREVNRVNADAYRKGVDLEEADKIQDLDERPRSLDNFGSKFDAWRVGNNMLFGPATIPDTRTNYGAATGITIEVLSEAESVMTVSISFREAPEGWPVRPEEEVRLAGPVIPYPLLPDTELLFGYAYIDSLSGGSRGDVTRWDRPGDFYRGPFLPNDASFGPVALIRGRSEVNALFFPLVDGSITSVGVEAGEYPGARNTVTGSSLHYLGCRAPCDFGAPLVSVVGTGEGTRVIARGITGDRDLALVGGSPVGPAVHAGPEDAEVLVIATDLPALFAIDPESGVLLWDFAPGAKPGLPVSFFYPNEVAASGTTEAIALPAGEELYLLDLNTGASLWDEPVRLEGDATGPAAIADIDRDGRPEILVGTDAGVVHAFNRTGAPAVGWPFRAESGIATDPRDPVAGPPTAGDWDGDGVEEVIFGTLHGALYIVEARGGLEEGFPLSVGGTPSFGPVLGRFPDRDSTFLLLPSKGGSLDILIRPGGEDSFIQWRGYQNGNGFSGRYEGTPHALTSGGDLLVREETFCYPNPVRGGGVARLHYRLGRPGTIEIRIADAAGTIVKLFDERPAPAETGEMVWDTRDVGSGVYFAVFSVRAGGNDATEVVPIAVTR